MGKCRCCLCESKQFNKTMYGNPWGKSRTVIYMSGRLSMTRIFWSAGRSPIIFGKLPYRTSQNLNIQCPFASPPVSLKSVLYLQFCHQITGENHLQNHQNWRFSRKFSDKPSNSHPEAPWPPPGRPLPTW